MVFFRVIKCHFHFYKKARVLVYTESYTANSCWINVSGPEIDAISALPSVIEANEANRLVLLNKAPSQRENFLLAAGAHCCFEVRPLESNLRADPSAHTHLPGHRCTFIH